MGRQGSVRSWMRTAVVGEVRGRGTSCGENLNGKAFLAEERRDNSLPIFQLHIFPATFSPNINNSEF